MSDSSLLELYFHFILIWVMVDMWVLFINNFSYRTLGMNEDSAYDSLIVALVVTSCSLIIIGSGINLLSSDGTSQIPYITINTSTLMNPNSVEINKIDVTGKNKILPSTINKEPSKDNKPINQPKIINLEDYFMTGKAKQKRIEQMSDVDQMFKLTSPKLINRL